MNEPTFHAGSKLAWIEQAAIDRNTTAFQVRVLIAISRRLNGAGEAIVSQPTIANTVGATVRGVRGATKRLQQNGHMEVDAAGCGRGNAARYRPIIKRRHGSSGFSTNSGAQTRNGNTRNSETHKAERGSMNGGTTVPPKTPYKNPIQNPGARGCAREADTSSDPLRVHWRAIKEGLAQSDRFGTEKVEAWLDKLDVNRIDGSTSTVLLTAPTNFIANYVTTHFEDILLECWRERDATIMRLRITLPGIAEDRLRVTPARIADDVEATTASSTDWSGENDPDGQGEIAHRVRLVARAPRGKTTEHSPNDWRTRRDRAQAAYEKLEASVAADEGGEEGDRNDSYVGGISE